jgi:hypothetical protein
LSLQRLVDDFFELSWEVGIQSNWRNGLAIQYRFRNHA